MTLRKRKPQTRPVNDYMNICISLTANCLEEDDCLDDECCDVEEVLEDITEVSSDILGGKRGLQFPHNDTSSSVSIAENSITEADCK